MEEMRLFPIQGGPAIPWSVIAPCERQAKANHGQSLERLAKRGGLGADEAVDVLMGWRWGTCGESIAETDRRGRLDEMNRRRAEIVHERHIEPLLAEAREHGAEAVVARWSGRYNAQAAELADLRQRIAHAIDVCRDPGLIPTGGSLAAEAERVLSTPMVVCRPCTEAGGADRAIAHEAPECAP